MSLKNWFWIVLIILVLASCANNKPATETSASPSFSTNPLSSLVPSIVPVPSLNQNLMTKTLRACLKNSYGVAVRVSPGEIGGGPASQVSWNGYRYPDNWPDSLTIVQPAVAGANWTVSDTTCPASGHTWYQIVDGAGKTLGYIYSGAFN
jgi:hypothetical protein